MKKTSVVGIGIFAGLAVFGYAIYYYFKKQANLLTQFTYSIISLNFTNFDLTLISGTVTFRFVSVSDLELTVSNFYMDLYFNGDKVGYIQDVTSFLLPARGYNDIPFSFSINPQTVLTNITDILAAAFQSGDGIITLDGYATASSGFIKATLPIKFNCSVKNMSCTQSS
jgi:hypothetical protein